MTPPEHGLLRHADEEHAEKEHRDLPQRPQGRALRRAGHPQVEAEGLAQQHKGDHPQQQPVQKAAAPLAVDPQPPGAPEQEHPRPQAEQLVDALQQEHLLGEQPHGGRPQQDQHQQEQLQAHRHGQQEQDGGQDAIEKRV